MAKPETLRGGVHLYTGDCLKSLDRMKENSVDAVVTDPPYHLTSIVKRFSAKNAAPAKHGRDGSFKRLSKGFMGHTWDGGDVAFRKETWAKVLRVMKPGAHLAAFCGDRNYHCLATAIEDAGFEIRHTLSWLYATGFPKNKHFLKPAMELICLARKPLSEKTVAKNVLKWGTGSINIDECRIDAEKPTGWGGGGAGGNTWNEDNCGLTNDGEARPVNGRWPANVLHDGSTEVIGTFPSVGKSHPPDNEGSIRKNIVFGEDKRPREFHPGFADKGSAARFYFSAKADSDDRLSFDHATVKPVDLIQWLVRLVTPENGYVLDPFAGTGTTGEAAWRERRKAILMEAEPKYQDMIRKRVEVMLKGSYAREIAKMTRKETVTGALFSAE